MVAFFVGILFGVLITLGAQSLLHMSAEESVDYDEESLCPHGVEWDDCPDCSH